MNTFFISGHHSIIYAIKNKNRIKKKLLLSKENYELEKLARENNIEIKIINKKYLSKLFIDSDLNHQNAALEVTPVKTHNLIDNISTLDDAILLNNIQDPRNIGSIIRTATAFAVKNLIIEKKNFDVFSNYIHRASSGCIDLINIYLVINLNHAIEILKKNNFWIVGFSNNQKISIFDFDWPKKTALVFGSEEKGIGANLLKNCDYQIEIPIDKSVESLNVSNSVSSALTIYKYKKNLIK
jgi:23S rRNA (guanosine2251-2'-O)-methyltransferase